MAFALEILRNTPAWVFLLFAFLVWQGVQATRLRTAPVWRMMIVPAVFILIGLSRIVTERNDGPWPPLAWLVAAALLVGVGFATGPRLLAVDRARGLVTRPGSILPLLRNVLVFLLQYGVAVEAAVRPDTHLTVSVIGRAVSGATAGYFIGWAWALRQRYLAATADVAGRVSGAPAGRR